MSHTEFKDLILPTIQKSLLRSPENVIESRFLLNRWAGGHVLPEQPCPCWLGSGSILRSECEACSLSPGESRGQDGSHYQKMLKVMGFLFKFIFVCACMPDRVRVLTESRRGHQIPWKLEFQAVLSWLVLVLEKQLVLCTAEPLLQSYQALVALRK